MGKWKLPDRRRATRFLPLLFIQFLDNFWVAAQRIIWYENLFLTGKILSVLGL